MSLASSFRQLTAPQRNAFLAAFLSWSLDALDFFLLVFCLPAIATEFHSGVPAVARGVFLTLAFRPLGALIFGALADRFGRKPVLIANIACYAAVELACAFAPSLASLLILRALFGVAMGGVWGIGAALTFETLPKQGRGTFSGILQEGYAIGYLLAAAAFGGLFQFVGWRGLFILGASPLLLVPFVLFGVQESPVWLESRRQRSLGNAPRLTLAQFRRYLPVFLFQTLLMTAFCSFSHGTQDMYPTFLTKGMHFAPSTVGTLGVIASVGSLLGGFVFGTLSERWGRKRAIITAALLAIPIAPLFAWGGTPALLALGAFLMQFMVQGAWGVVPAYLTELSPAPVRAVFPGVTYQLGNLITSWNLVLQTTAAERIGSYSPVLAGTVLAVSLTLALIAFLGRESRGTDLTPA